MIRNIANDFKIHELDDEVKEELSLILENMQQWTELAKLMGFNHPQINEIQEQATKKNVKPSLWLLMKWGQYNHTVLELFVLLFKLKNVPGMIVLSPCVPKEYLILKERTVDINPLDTDNLPQPLIDKENECTIRIGNSEGKPAEKNSEKHPVSIEKIKYKDLELATNGWHDDNLIGKGGFGRVYKGILHNNPISIKWIFSNFNKGLMNELSVTRCQSKHILQLYGYSDDGLVPCVVHELMEGGSLEQRLTCKKGPFTVLTWAERLSIMCDVARGLQYMHSIKPIIVHGDIKPGNILLTKHLEAKIGDFGLSLSAYEDSDSHVTVNSSLRGTNGYLPPEYKDSRISSREVDIYSYGVMLIQVATFIKVNLGNDSKESPIFLAEYIRSLPADTDYASLEDPRLRKTTESRPELCREFVQLGVQCTSYKREERPQMDIILAKLCKLTA